MALTYFAEFLQAPEQYETSYNFEEFHKFQQGVTIDAVPPRVTA